jgi:phosphoheptose isomerase
MSELDIENIGEKFRDIVSSLEWHELQEKFNQCDDIYVLGHGGNMAIADHTAVDITRLSGGRKNAQCPGSAVVATSFINDSNFDQWMVNWLGCRTTVRSKREMGKSLVYGISSSGKSTDVIKALQWASEHGMETALVTGQDMNVEIPNLTKIVLGTEYYHTCEVLTLLLQYQLTHGSGRECPPIGKNSPEELERLNWKGGKIREHSYPDEKVNVGIDFDGVLHKNSKGFYDGTIYDDPIEGSYKALERISKDYVIIIHTCKAKPDRGLIDGKTGTELVWNWLKEHNMAQFVSKVTAEKPRARLYIDDKAISFSSWDETLRKVYSSSS